MSYALGYSHQPSFSMPPTERARLQHMLEAARDICEFVRGRTREDLDTDRMLRHTLIRCFEIIGLEEALSESAP